MPDEKPPHVSRGVYWRAALAGMVIVLGTAAAVSTAALLKVKDVVQKLQHYGHVAHFSEGTIKIAKPGKPQTILLVGSDKRFGQTNRDARSDTMMLVRMDPHQQATAVMSIPRDLVTDIPGYGREKINAAYSYGGLDLTTRTVEQVTGLDINHAIEVNFSGFREAVDFIGCVYTDVDRRYYHSNAGLPPSQQYSEINIQPGYQRLCGTKALEYVRYRHGDSDIVRAARQQDFLRQAKSQVGSSRLLSDLDPLTTIFAKATETDHNLQTESGILRLLKLAAFSTGHPTREIHFPFTYAFDGTPPTFSGGRLIGGTTGGLGSYVTASPGAIRAAVYRFMHAKKAPSKPSKKLTGTTGTHAKKKGKSRAAGSVDWSAYNLIDARRTGEDMVVRALANHPLPFPMYYPGALTQQGVYPTPAPNAPSPRVYSIKDRAGHKHMAYRIVVSQNPIEGQYFGVQGTNWMTPPLLDGPNDQIRMAGRSYHVYYDGTKTRAIAWRTPKAVYWVSNTLSLDLSNKQMLGIARSLIRLGGN